jgi:hypothetical protein
MASRRALKSRPSPHQAQDSAHASPSPRPPVVIGIDLLVATSTRRTARWIWGCSPLDRIGRAGVSASTTCHADRAAVDRRFRADSGGLAGFPTRHADGHRGCRAVRGQGRGSSRKGTLAGAFRMPRDEPRGGSTDSVRALGCHLTSGVRSGWRPESRPDEDGACRPGDPRHALGHDSDRGRRL